jgi:hypothetical protein
MSAGYHSIVAACHAPDVMTFGHCSQFIFSLKVLSGQIGSA